MEISENNQIPTSLWVETRILRAKTYILRKDVERAISTLKDICYILTPFPTMTELPFIDSVLMYGQTEDLYLSELDEGTQREAILTRRASEQQKYMSFAGMASKRDQTPFEFAQNDDQFQTLAHEAYLSGLRGSTVNNQANALLEHYRSGTLQKVQIKFDMTSSRMQQTTGGRYGAGAYNTQSTQGNGCETMREMMTNRGASICNKSPRKFGKGSILQQSKRGTMVMSILKDSQYGGGAGGGFTDRYLGSVIGLPSTLLDSEGFAVYSNLKFLYLIGKISSETASHPEDGLNALGDYLTLIEYFREDVPEETYDRLRVKAQYCIGMIFYKQGDYEMSQQYLGEIVNDLWDQGYKKKFEKAQGKLVKIRKEQQRGIVIINDYYK
ncbi:hypothetical protein FGO68_gene17101 [Halteria grandinella]|uniref:Uncharacterized protein n=1 Tax=Halteria grandinella TaxID=5974 RepID=A0A8J8NFI9_HALGN|nr:hypothetical protein FGO68_gene17101 [Halteria grandinella]